MDKSLLIAIYGAVISTILAVREIVLLVTEFIREKRRLKITVECYIIEKEIKKGKKKIFSYVRINATNIGRRPVVIVMGGFFLNNPSTTSFGMGPANSPLKLDDGDTVNIDFECEYIQKHAGNSNLTKAYISDTEGKFYTTRINKKVKEFIHYQSKK